MFRMMVDHKMAIGSECVGAGPRRAEPAGGAGHPLFHRVHDWLNVTRRVHFPPEMLRIAELAPGMESGFDAVAEIGKTVERRWQTVAIEQKRRKPAGRVFVGRRREPGLHVPLDLDGDAESLERFLEPRA